MNHSFHSLDSKAGKCFSLFVENDKQLLKTITYMFRVHASQVVSVFITGNNYLMEKLQQFSSGSEVMNGTPPQIVNLAKYVDNNKKYISDVLFEVEKQASKMKEEKKYFLFLDFSLILDSNLVDIELLQKTLMPYISNKDIHVFYCFNKAMYENNGNNYPGLANFTVLPVKCNPQPSVENDNIKEKQDSGNLEVISFEGDFEFRGLFLHGPVEKVIGYTKDELLSGNPRWDQIIHPDDMEELLRHKEDLRTKPGFKVKRDLRVRRKDGRVITVTEILYNVCDGNNKPILVQGVVFEKNDSVIFDENSLDIFKFYEYALKSEDEGIWFVDKNLKTFYINKKMEEIVGIPKEQIIGKSAMDFVSDSKAGEVGTIMSYLNLDKNIDQTVDFVNYRREEFNLRIKAAPLKGSKNELIGFAGIVKDITKEIKQERKILFTEKNLDNIFNNYPDSLIITEKTFNIVDVNKKAVELFGVFSVEEMLNKNLSDYLSTKGKNKLDTFIRNIIEKNEFDKKMEVGFCVNRKKKIVAEVSFNLIYDSERDQELYILFIKDITQLKEAEASLRESEKRYRLLAENSRDVIWKLGPDTNFEYVSPSVSYFFDFTQKDFLKFSLKDLKKIFTRDSYFKFVKALNKMLSSTAPQDVTLELEAITRDGEYFWLEQQLITMMDDDKNFLGILGVARDIDKRKNAEIKLKHSENTKRLILEAMSEFVIYLDADLRIQWTNRAVKLKTEKDTGFLSELHCYESWNFRDTPCEGCPILKARDSGKPEEAEMQTSDGKFWQIRGYPVKDSDGSIIGFVEIAQDITKIKEAMKEIRKSESELRSLTSHMRWVREEERARISRQVHDELGQSLTALKFDIALLNKHLPAGNTRLLERGKTMKDAIDSIIKKVQRISTEIRPSILDDFGLAAAMEWQVKQFQEKTGIRCSLGINPDLTFKNKELSTTLFRILQESLTNIARHAEASEARIILRKKEKEIELIIKDNGVGIKEEHITSADSLGLIGMKEQALSFGGEFVIAESNEGGTEIRVVFPLLNNHD